MKSLHTILSLIVVFNKTHGSRKICEIKNYIKLLTISFSNNEIYYIIIAFKKNQVPRINQVSLYSKL